jgi:hypothetical protein
VLAHVIGPCIPNADAPLSASKQEMCETEQAMTAHLQDLARVVAQHIGLVGEVPCHDGGVVRVGNSCDAVLPGHNCVDVLLEGRPARNRQQRFVIIQ